MPYQFYRNLLSKEEQKLYDLLYIGFECCEHSIRLPKVDKRTVQHVFKSVLYDNPHIFYVEGLNTRYTIFSTNTVVYPVYKFNAETISSHERAYRSVVNRIVAYSKTFDDYEKVKLVHDLFCRKIRYDTNHPNAHSIVGALIDKIAVCDGIARAAKLLFDAMELESCIVCGKATQNDVPIENHAWNKVNINGYWYNLDITFDVECSKYGCIRYDYFNVSDVEISKEHQQAQYAYPICNNNEASFYYRNNLCINSKEEFESLFYKMVSMGEKQISAKWKNEQILITVDNIEKWAEETIYKYMTISTYEIYYNLQSQIFSIIVK